jgi:hypothetical protein
VGGIIRLEAPKGVELAERREIAKERSEDSRPSGQSALLHGRARRCEYRYSKASWNWKDLLRSERGGRLRTERLWLLVNARHSRRGRAVLGHEEVLVWGAEL